jgi:hypothetical protein
LNNSWTRFVLDTFLLLFFLSAFSPRLLFVSFQAAENEDYEAAAEQQENCDVETQKLEEFEATSQSHKEAVAIAKTQLPVADGASL